MRSWKNSPHLEQNSIPGREEPWFPWWASSFSTPGSSEFPSLSTATSRRSTCGSTSGESKGVSYEGALCLYAKSSHSVPLPPLLASATAKNTWPHGWGTASTLQATPPLGTFPPRNSAQGTIGCTATAAAPCLPGFPAHHDCLTRVRKRSLSPSITGATPHSPQDGASNTKWNTRAGGSGPQKNPCSIVIPMHSTVPTSSTPFPPHPPPRTPRFLCTRSPFRTRNPTLTANGPRRGDQIQNLRGPAGS